MLTLGEADRIAAREPLVRAVLASLKREVGGLDPALVGSWHYLSTRSSMNRDLAGRVAMTSASDTNRYVRLDPNGSATLTERSRMIASIPGLSLDTGDNVTMTRGRWNAADSKVVLLWENGTTATYTYRLGASPQGRTIELTGGDGSTQIWGEVG